MESKRKFTNLKLILALGSYDTKAFGFEEITQPNNTEVNQTIKNSITCLFFNIYLNFLLLNQGNDTIFSQINKIFNNARI